MVTKPTEGEEETSRVRDPFGVRLDESQPAPPSSTAGDRPSAVFDERRGETRYSVNARALLLANGAMEMPGRILDLSRKGCRIRTVERFTLGIFVRVEVEFHLRGMTFRLSGITQSVQQGYSVGVRFLGVSERARIQLVELIGELSAMRG